jgi:hypothetical protein
LRTAATKARIIRVFQFMLVAKMNFQKGGANLPVCRDARQGIAHLSGNSFWQPLQLV